MSRAGKIVILVGAVLLLGGITLLSRMLFPPDATRQEAAVIQVGSENPSPSVDAPAKTCELSPVEPVQLLRESYLYAATGTEGTLVKDLIAIRDGRFTYHSWAGSPGDYSIYSGKISPTEVTVHSVESRVYAEEGQPVIDRRGGRYKLNGLASAISRLSPDDSFAHFGEHADRWGCTDEGAGRGIFFFDAAGGPFSGPYFRIERAGYNKLLADFEAFQREQEDMWGKGMEGVEPAVGEQGR